jgi:hypothetical protein
VALTTSIKARELRTVLAGAVTLWPGQTILSATVASPDPELPLNLLPLQIVPLVRIDTDFRVPAMLILLLVHGFMGWGDDAIGPSFRKAYFYGIKEFLLAEGAAQWPHLPLRIVAPSLPAVAGIPDRGAVLQGVIEQELRKAPERTRVHLLAHSLGGLDARWVLV